MGENYDYEYEKMIGEWVTARCAKRYNLKGKMPDYVITWLETGGNSPVNQDSEAPPDVEGWLIKTIDDPDWPER